MGLIAIMEILPRHKESVYKFWSTASTYSLATAQCSKNIDSLHSLFILPVRTQISIADFVKIFIASLLRALYTRLDKKKITLPTPQSVLLCNLIRRLLL